MLAGLGYVRVRSPLLTESLICFLLLQVLRWFTSLSSLYPTYRFSREWLAMPAGFPHSEISGSKVACTSPKLIAACHVLLRLHAPRHPPCALSSLTIKFAQNKRCLSTALFQQVLMQLTCAFSPSILRGEHSRLPIQLSKSKNLNFCQHHRVWWFDAKNSTLLIVPNELSHFTK